MKISVGERPCERASARVIQWRREKKTRLTCMKQAQSGMLQMQRRLRDANVKKLSLGHKRACASWPGTAAYPHRNLWRVTLARGTNFAHSSQSGHVGTVPAPLECPEGRQGAQHSLHAILQGLQGGHRAMAHHSGLQLSAMS